MGFWDKVGKFAATIIEEGPELLSALAEKGAKQQGQALKNAEHRINEYERKVSNSQQSKEMNNPEYARRINDAKQKLENVKIEINKKTGTGSCGTATLKSAANSSNLENSPGVYILRLDGELMKVGSAVIGVQKRMQQYYGLNTACGLNKHINNENRDRITIAWQHCSTDKCNELESKLFNKYGGVQNMPWAERRPNCSNDSVSLKI
ncbi:hypothetical protein K9O30_06320 [Clostridium bowmanii]|uniref:hypothetical protein n=1 Tax=Clostridium bowmanii TaxID=132925 RepID=UPI001C0ACCA5|nr:hypothetical protein [Clostridium bowmanii]MBU3188775.1 hypothetical protein [Clostridium bowmanii]MCA1073359.1 hypothetical protein [Clostridium bowmanii]